MAGKLASNILPSRSGNADYTELHKFDDATRYNISTYNVAFYKNSPNRQGTPIPIKPSETSQHRRKTISAKEKYLGDIIKRAPFIENIYKQALKFHPRNTSAKFPLVRHTIRVNNAVYNDYHIRETNVGYARNGLGGFYTK